MACAGGMVGWLEVAQAADIMNDLIFGESD